MTNTRDLIKAHIVPSLRSRGFTGSYPHFRRTEGGDILLLSFQLDRWGTGDFVCELACLPDAPLHTSWGEVFPQKSSRRTTPPPVCALAPLR